ncbi:Synaptonemal complex protein 2-like, partial [Chaetura pelagica]
LQLESLLTEAFKGKGFQKISELLQEREIEPPQKYSKSLFSQLDKALRKELDKNEFQNVSLLLKCIQLYLKSDLQEGTSLFIEQGLVLTVSFNFYLVSWFERARAFVIVINSDENKFFMLLFEDFFDSALVICKCSNEGKKELVNLFLPELGNLVTEENICYTLRQEALRTLNSILDSVPREERKKFPLSEEMCSLTKDLAKTILEVGDYDLQVALSEALCRLMTKKWRDDLVHHWFEDNYLAEAFKEIKDREFETDCRKFLNQLNERLGDKRRVYSFPCISAFADMNEVKKPSDEKLEKFWIDFNTGSQSVTFYVDSNEGALWDSVRLSEEAVRGYSLREINGEKIVKIYMKIPATFNRIIATKIKISFSAEFEILSVLRKILGDEKMMINMAEEESVHDGKKTRQNEAAKADKVFNSSSKDEAVVSLPPSEKKSKTPSPRMKAKPRLMSVAGQEGKGTVPEDPCCSSGYSRASLGIMFQKHLFSESNNENTSTGQSEKSWILNSQKRSLSKSLDYSKKRRRVRSKLKVLPVSSASSGSDYQTKKQGASKQRPQKEMQRKKTTSSSKGDDVATVDLTGISFLQCIRKIVVMLVGLVIPVMVFAGVVVRCHSVPHAEEKFCSETSVLFLDTLSGTALKKPKFSTLETNHLPSDYKQRKFSDSAEKEEEIQTDNVNDASFSKMLHEDSSDSGVTAAFESFIGQLKELFWSRYKKMEVAAQNTLRTSEKNVSALLNQIHECRLNKLETFQKIVVEELTSLEKENQVLANMEKDAVEFWNAQFLKLSSFCKQQKERYVSASC